MEHIEQGNPKVLFDGIGIGLPIAKFIGSSTAVRLPSKASYDREAYSPFIYQIRDSLRKNEVNRH